jgi:hypothetical protein
MPRELKSGTWYGTDTPHNSEVSSPSLPSCKFLDRFKKAYHPYRSLKERRQDYMHHRLLYRIDITILGPLRMSRYLHHVHYPDPPATPVLHPLNSIPFPWSCRCKYLLPSILYLPPDLSRIRTLKWGGTIRTRLEMPVSAYITNACTDPWYCECIKKSYVELSYTHNPTLIIRIHIITTCFMQPKELQAYRRQQ